MTAKLPDAFDRMQLERQSTPQQITEILEAEILGGSLKPGDRLRETQLAEGFGVSRNTLREALRVLERKGLIRHIPHRGAEVTRLTESDVADIYHARDVLERAGARTATTRGGDLTALRGEVDGIESCGADGDNPGLLEHDFAFHRLLVEPLGSPRLSTLYEGLQRELRLALSALDSFDASPQIEEHRLILEALEAGDGDAADALVSRHLDVAAARLRELVSGQA